MKIVDSNVWIALFHPKDAHHARAVEELELFRQKKGEIIITDYVLIEVSTVLLARVGKTASNKFIEFVMKDMRVRFLQTSKETFLMVLGLFRKASGSLSFVDVSLLLMSKILKADLLTYDKELRGAA